MEMATVVIPVTVTAETAMAETAMERETARAKLAERLQRRPRPPRPYPSRLYRDPSCPPLRGRYLMPRCRMRLKSACKSIWINEP